MKAIILAATLALVSTWSASQPAKASGPPDEGQNQQPKRERVEESMLLVIPLPGDGLPLMRHKSVGNLDGRMRQIEKELELGKVSCPERLVPLLEEPDSDAEPLLNVLAEGGILLLAEALDTSGAMRSGGIYLKEGKSPLAPLL